MTKEEADAAVAAAKERVVEAARVITQHRNRDVAVPTIVMCMDELLAAEAARKALDRPRLMTPAERAAAHNFTSRSLIVDAEYVAAIVKVDRDHVLAEAAKLPSSSIAEERQPHWTERDRLISLADLGRLIRGE